MARWRWLLMGFVALLAVAGAVAANQILNDGVWHWWPWAPIAVVAPLVGVALTDRLTRSASGGRQVGSGGEEVLEGPPVTLTAPNLVLVGEGAGNVQEAFQAAYDAAGGPEVIGVAQEPVSAVGPGYVQPFAGRDQSGRVIVCGIPDRPATVIPMSVWDVLREVGGDPDDEDGVIAAGLPVSPSATEPLVLVGSAATTVDLVGGQWGPGRLRRARPGEPWWWEPQPVVDFEVSSHADRWATIEPVDLQLRAVAEFPWRPSAVPSQVTPQQARLLQRAMATTEFGKVFTVLSMHRGALVAAPEWSTATGPDSYGSDRCVHLRAVLAAPDTRPALTGDVLLHMPDFAGPSSVLGCAQLRINRDAWHAALDAAGVDRADRRDTRMTLREVIEVLASAWSTVMGAVPRVVVDDPRQVPITRPPFVAMYLKTNPPASTHPHEGLADVVDLGPLGLATRAGARTQTGMRVFGPWDLARPARRELLADGLARLGRSWGYVEATADGLLTGPGASREPVAGQ